MDEQTDVHIVYEKDEKLYASLAHFLTFCGYAFPLANIIAPLVIFLIKKDESDYVRYHSTEALNFQISMTIYTVISVILAFFIIGFFLLLAIFIVDVVCTIVAGIKANEARTIAIP